MNRTYKLTQHLSMLAVAFLLLLAHGNLQAAALTVTSSVLPQGVNYLYDFAITNNSTTDPEALLVSVDFSLPAGSIIGLATAPAGNGALTDPSGNFVEFSSDNLSGFPAGITVDGFQFVSPLQFGSFSYVGNYLNSAQTTVTPVGGTTTPQTPASVPEPGTWGLLAGASVWLIAKVRRSRS